MNVSEKQREANVKNAQRSTGPKSEEGVLACKGNALRHGLRSLQTVVPGEDFGEWKAHRLSVLDDLSPQGAVEVALAEQIAAKLWRLGRVVQHEADIIAIAQDRDVIRAAHEKAHRRPASMRLSSTDIPSRADVDDARKESEAAERKAAERLEARRQLEAAARMSDEETLPDWRIYETIKEDRIIRESVLDRLFLGDEDGPLRAGQVRKMLASLGGIDEVRATLLDTWKTVHEKRIVDATKARRRSASLLKRYKAALDRRRRSNGLPSDADLNRIQRYEAHLERGMHKALDRLRDLQECRGALAPRGPSVAVAVVQANPQNPIEGQMGSFGILPYDATESGRWIGGDPCSH